MKKKINKGGGREPSRVLMWVMQTCVCVVFAVLFVMQIGTKSEQ